MRKTTAGAPALAAAFAALTAEGVPVTVRSLRERASVGTDTARAWLAANRPSADAPEVPAEALALALAPLWEAAMAAARDEVAESVATQVQAARESEATALTEVERLTDEFAAATAETEAQTREVQRLVEDGEDLRREVAAARRVADEATEERRAAEARAQAAELAAADAAATARTLREVIDSQRPAADAKDANSKQD